MRLARDHFDVVFYVPTIAPLLANDPARPAGGAETQVRALTRALAADGVNVAVVAYDWPGLPREDEGVRVLRRPPPQANPAREAWAIGVALQRAGCSVVVTRQAGAHAGVVAVAARLTRRRFVYAAANVLDFDFTTFEKHRAKSALFELGLRLAHRVVVQTDEQRELCVRKLGHSPPVIRSLAEPAPLRVRTPEAFLWAGRVVSYKQPLKYVDLALALPEAQFWMVAVPDDALEEDRALLAELRARAASAPNLRLTPALSRPELLDLMESAVAVVSTSSSEGMPNIWLEGWSRGIPALTLQHDPDSLIEKHGLGQSCRGDMAEFVSAARSLWNGRAHQGELAEVCRAYVAREHSPVAAARKWRQALGI